MSRLVCMAVLMAVTLVVVGVAFGQDHRHRASPFDSIRWVGNSPEVQLENAWYRPIAIDGLEVTAIIAVCEKRWPGQLRKRFSEDLMEAMALLGIMPGDSVTLKLVSLADDSEVVLGDIPNTLVKRQQLWRGNIRRRGDNRRKASLTREEVLADLQTFEEVLRRRFAYLELKDVAWEEDLKAIRTNLVVPLAPARLAVDLHQLMMRFGDGHASVSAREFDPGERGPFLPFLMADSAAGVVAFAPGREAFLDPEHPLVVSLGGFPIADCVAAIGPEIVDGSPQVIRHRSLRLLRDVSVWYPRLTGEADIPSLISVGVVSTQGSEPTELRVGLALAKPTFGTWPRTRSRPLEGSIGYLRLESMNGDAVEEVHRRMPEFRKTRGLVVDVRGNGGGSREALSALAGYLVGPEQGPWVGNVAAYRLSDFDGNHLDARFMYRADHGDWTDAEAAVVERMASRFAPEWELPDGFSEWHYLVLDRTGHPNEYHYDRPVVVLSDAGCFSATDIFLGALEIHPAVTLIGTASAGGSARSQQFELPNSGIRVRCASMASFRPNGRLYDGRGVEVDIKTLPNSKFFLQGGRDAVLEAAVAFLKKN